VVDYVIEDLLVIGICRGLKLVTRSSQELVYGLCVAPSYLNLLQSVGFIYKINRGAKVEACDSFHVIS